MIKKLCLIAVISVTAIFMLINKTDAKIEETRGIFISYLEYKKYLSNKNEKERAHGRIYRCGACQRGFSFPWRISVLDGLYAGKLPRKAGTGLSHSLQLRISSGGGCDHHHCDQLPACKRCT